MIKFYIENLIDSASIAASTTNAQYPIANLTHDFRTKVWRSTSNSDNIVFDMGAAVDVDTIAIADNWRNGFGFSTMTIEANATDVWTSPAFSTTLTYDADFGIGFKEFTTETYRYWRIVLTSTLGYCEIANIFIGEKTEISTNGISYGFAHRQNDLKKVSTTRYGQEYIDDFGTRKEISSMSFEVMNNTEMDFIYEIYDSRRTVKPFFVKLGDGTNTIISNENRLNGLYKLKSAPSVRSKTIAYWDVTLSVLEQK